LSSDLRLPRRLLAALQPVPRLGVVTPLERPLLIENAPCLETELVVALGARRRQRREPPAHVPRIHLRDVEVRLLVCQHATALHAVAEHHGLDPRVVGVKGGDHAKLEHAPAALPGVVDPVRGLGGLLTSLRRRALEVAPGEPPSR